MRLQIENKRLFRNYFNVYEANLIIFGLPPDIINYLTFFSTSIHAPNPKINLPRKVLTWYSWRLFWRFTKKWPFITSCDFLQNVFNWSMKISDTVDLPFSPNILKVFRKVSWNINLNMVNLKTFGSFSRSRLVAGTGRVGLPNCHISGTSTDRVPVWARATN